MDGSNSDEIRLADLEQRKTRSRTWSRVTATALSLIVLAGMSLVAFSTIQWNLILSQERAQIASKEANLIAELQEFESEQEKMFTKLEITQSTLRHAEERLQSEKELLLSLQEELDTARLISGGRFAEATVVLKTKLAKQEKNLSPDYADLIPTLNQLAQITQASRQYSEVEEMYQRVLDISIMNFGDENPETIGAMINLASAKFDLDDFSGAEALYAAAYEIENGVSNRAKHERSFIMALLEQSRSAKRAEARSIEIKPLFKDGKPIYPILPNGAEIQVAKFKKRIAIVNQIDQLVYEVDFNSLVQDSLLDASEKYLAVALEDEIIVFDLETAEEIISYRIALWLSQLDFSNDGKAIEFRDATGDHYLRLPEKIDSVGEK